MGQAVRGRSILLLAGGALLLVLLAVYAFVDPSQAWWMPKCPVYTFTGWQCPGCGSQRAVHALLQGDFSEAFAHNALFLLMIPFLALMAYAEFSRLRRPRLYRALNRPVVIISVSMLILSWAVVRNLI